MSEAKMITLSKLKGMSGADIIALVRAGGFSLEINGEHIGDVVRPLNVLDEHLIAVSRYIATEVAAEMKRKAETLKVEDMFNPRTTQDILDAVAQKVVIETPKAPEPVEEKLEKPVKASKAKTKAAPAAAKPKRVRTKPAQAALPVVLPEAAEQDLHLSPFPDTTEPEDDTPIEDLLSQDEPVSDASDARVAEDIETASAGVIETDQAAADAAFDADFDEVDDGMDDIPTLTAEDDSATQESDAEEVPAAALFDDLLLDEDDNLLTEEAALPAQSQDEEDDIFGDDTPLVRKMVRRT